MIDGKLYLAGRSDFSPAKLYLQAGGFQLHAEGNHTVTGSIDQLRVANRLGNIARKITLPDGSVFETKDNDAVDTAFANNNQSSGFMGFVHMLERNMALAIFSIFITAGVLFASFKWGLPAASHVVAHALPASANQALSGNVLAFLDKYFLDESQLDEQQQEKIRQHFIDRIVPLYLAEDAPEFKLHFRLWPLGEDGSIPNALALPSGDIVVTDRFIELAQYQDEIDIVLLHEMGHVVERHSLQQVIEGSAIIIVVSMAFGDVSWLADMGVGVGSFFISSFYSRSHETEADQFAYEHSLHAGINPASLGLILTRMEQDMLFDGSDSSSDKTNNKKSKPDTEATDPNEANDESLSGYFSTHPSSAERTAMGKRFQTCFEQGLTVCPETNFK
ncbi:MAG: M48 family metallopeptidase [Methylophaga sp.]|nr:M48 family metallopeptidase [Methylophaga sp.]